MKYLCLVLALFFTLQLSAREITVIGKIKNPTARQMNFSYVVDYLIEEEKLTVANLNADNEIYFILNHRGQNVLKANYNGYEFEIFVENEVRIEFSFDAEDIINTLKFKGQSGINNNYLVEYRKLFESKGEVRRYNKGYLTCEFTYETVKSALEKNFVKHQDLVSKDFQRKMDFLYATKNISADFKNYLNTKISFSTGAARLAFFVVNQNDYTASDFLQLATAHDFKSDHVFLNRIDNKDYLNYWKAYVFVEFLKKIQRDPNPGFAFYQIADKQLQGETRAFFLAKIMINAKKENNESIAKQNYIAFRKSVKEPYYPDQVAKFYGGTLDYNEEGAAADFQFYDDNGILHSLSNFKGQVVYISFWATWCKPCLMNFRKTVSIRQQLMDIGVVLINVSLDESDGLWKSTMSRVPMPGVNLRSGNDEALKLNYELSRLPAYYIVDKKGKLAYLPDGTRDILAEFEKLVKQ